MSRRLISYAVGLSVLMIMLIIPIQYFLDYRAAMIRIDDAVKQTQSGYLPSLAAALWNFDESRVRLNLENLVQQPFASFAQVKGELDMEVRVGQLPRESARHSLEFPIIQQDGNTKLGELLLVFNKEAASNYAWDRVRGSFIALCVYTLLFAGLMLVLVQRVVTFRLLRLSDFAQNLRLDNLGQEPKLRPHRGNDELDQLTRHLLEMRSQLATDREDLKRFEEELAKRASEDQLTELPNRFCFLEQLHKLLDKEHSPHFALLFIDLDGFKKVNDTLGHMTGDELLIQTGARIRSILSEKSFLARYGGDEFVVIRRYDDEDDIRKEADRLTHGFTRPFKVFDNLLYLSVSIGIALYPDDADSGEELLKRADAAMYQAKARGRSLYLFFDHDMYQRLCRRVELEDKLREAIDKGEMMVMYQPIVSTRNGRLIGVEALLRWHSADLGWIDPEQFIPLAEETGKILELGAWVLKKACAQIRQWQGMGKQLKVSVNVSNLQLHHSDFAEQVAAILAETQAPPEMLQLEITESAVLEEHKITLDNMHKLKEMGIAFVLDDFGTGYSSLSYIQQLPLDGLKIDKSFVDAMLTSERDMALLEGIISLAKALSLTMTAEGIESKEQAQALLRLGVDALQGHLLGEALPADELDWEVRQQIGQLNQPA
ncbi:EAL domain-containing protein [Gallaecimonas sp. GXIMD4217]|uniref:putative bifunctional diguanylate cyclase/phosphodiesterase n=1 Tax=Gallaecimonas sp. GXIMD4217 TaxID=3131927 RepID=UPI00311ADEEF